MNDVERAFARFWPKVDKNGPVPAVRLDLGPCWIWTAYIDPSGYGRFLWRRRPHLAYRWLWEQQHGPVPEGLELDHLCRRPSCVSPDHLEPVTHRENMLRSSTPAALAARQTTCQRGHAYTPENTYINALGHRYCRVCKRERERRYWAERRAESAA